MYTYSYLSKTNLTKVSEKSILYLDTNNEQIHIQ